MNVLSSLSTTGTRVAPLPLRRSRPRRGLPLRGLLLAGVLLAGFVALPAYACTSSLVRPLVHDSTHENYESDSLLSYTAAVHHIRDCTTNNEDLDIWVQVDIPGLRPVGTRWWKTIRIPVYETGPDSPLLGFSMGQAQPASISQPLEPGVRTRLTPALTRNDMTVQFNVVVLVFSRGPGERMRSIELSGTQTWEVGAYPALGAVTPANVKVTFPATTCPLQDVAETLQDVQLSELPSAGSHARAKDVVVRMLCGADAPRARLTLQDAGDAGNDGSLLTPTADSDAEGVRIQLLRGGSEVKFGERWDFDPGTGGTHDHVFTARYLRTIDPLKPGVIRGEAVLDVDYW